MSLQFVIDGNNIINHTQYTRIPKRIKNTNHYSALLDLIKAKRLTGSPRNRTTVIFDGYPDYNLRIQDAYQDMEVIFSRGSTADERIKKILETSRNTKNIVVVTDDKEIRFFAKACGAQVSGVEEFILPGLPHARSNNEEPLIKTELNYTQKHKINEEVKKIWLK